MRELLKKLLILFVIVISILPLSLVVFKSNNIHALSLPVDFLYWFSLDWEAKSNILGVIYTIGAYSAAAIGVIAYISNTNKYIDPEVLIEVRKKKIIFSPEQLPFTKNLTFFINNNGNISIEEKRVNYTLLIPIDIQIERIPIHATDAGKAIQPGYAQNYENDTEMQALGGQNPSIVFPNRMRRLCYIKATFNAYKMYELKYFFVSDYGFFPKSILVDKHNEPIKSFAKILIEIRNPSAKKVGWGSKILQFLKSQNKH